jgi:VWFA-related protein
VQVTAVYPTVLEQSFKAAIIWVFRMRFFAIILLSLAAWLAPLMAAPNSAQDGLPTTPSSSQQQPAPAAQGEPQDSSPQAQSPAPEQPSAPKTSEEPAAEQQAPASVPDSANTTSEENPAAASAGRAAKSPELTKSAPATDDVDSSLPTIRRRVDEVNVVFTVTDKHGHYVKDLKKDDFRVLDDKQPAIEIRSFRSETDLPLQVGLLIDASNSVRDRFKFEQEAAIEFLNQIIRPRYDKALVVGFDVTPEVTQDFTDDTEALSRGVRALRPGGGTAMYDALYFACRDKLLKAKQGVTTRRAIILLSDGEDNQSHVTREEAIEMAERADAIIYTISTNVSGMRSKGDKVLERIAEATGGRAFFPFQIRNVSDDFAVIQDELRSQYALSYKPADFKFNGKYRTIEILAQNHKNLRVRSRHGYFAPVQ